MVPSATPMASHVPSQTSTEDVSDPGTVRSIESTTTNCTDVVPALRELVGGRGLEETLIKVLQTLISVPPPLGYNTPILSDLPTKFSQLSSPE